MSSEVSAGTSSSRLRQFGLYRNIDERTEEFLNLSRKRQIRQGCACAAVSTAITVTVVVSVLIVFEYGLHSDPEPTPQPKHKPNWFSMLNDSEVKFDTNQQHASIRSSVLLPLLLKALKQNRILEKAIEEYTSNTPNYEDATAYPLERNVFTDARNWLGIPPARMYAIEYKTSPIVFFKSRNIDLFSRTRKMMDSRRVTNYLDRMMNDKAAYVTRAINNGETDNTIKKISSTARPKRATTHLARVEKSNKSTAKTDTAATTTKKLHINDCICPNNLRDILQKLLFGVQKLFSLNSQNIIVKSEDCVSTTIAPKLKTKTFNASRTTTATKRPPKVTNMHSALPFHFFKTILLPKANFTTKLTDKLGRTETQSTTGKIDPTSLLNSETTRKQNYAFYNVNETTTFKPYLEVPFSITITPTKPMVPVITEGDTHRIRTTENLMKRSQNPPPPQYVNYDVNYVQLNPTTLIPSKVTTYDEDSWKEENEETKKKTLSNFLFKYKESKKNNEKFGDNRIEMFDDHYLDSDTMRTFNTGNEFIKEFNVEPEFKFTAHAKKMNGSFLKSKSKIAATKDEFGTIIRGLTAWNTVPFNITYGSIRVPNDSNEKPISVLPQLSSPFLQLQRNEGRQEKNDYHAKTNC